MGYIFKGNLFCTVINVINVNGTHISKSLHSLLSLLSPTPCVLHGINIKLKQRSEREKAEARSWEIDYWLCIWGLHLCKESPAQTRDSVTPSSSSWDQHQAFCVTPEPPSTVPCSILQTCPLVPQSGFSKHCCAASGQQKREAPKITTHGVCLAHCMTSSWCIFFPLLSPLCIARGWLQRRYGEASAHHFASLTRHPAHRCFGFGGFEAPSASTSSNASPAVIVHGTVSRSPSRWGRAHPSWRKWQTLGSLPRPDFYNFCIPVACSWCSAPTHTNSNQLQRTGDCKKAEIH